MKIKFGSIVVAGSGKIGGHVASRNRAGSYMRTRVTPMNPNSPYQAGARNRLSTISTAWRGLEPEEILAWNGAVSMFKGTNIFGDLKTPSGFNLFQKLNNNLLRTGEEDLLSTPPLPVALPVIVGGELAAVPATSVKITFDAAIDVSATVVEAWATPAISPGVSFVKSQFRVIGLLGTYASGGYDLTEDYEAKFGEVGIADMKIFVMLRQISNVTGQAGIPVIYSCIIT